MIASGSHGADLCFGHDSNLYRLLSLLGATKEGHTGQDGEGEYVNLMDEVILMAANLQLVFFRSPDHQVYVLPLHNEHIERLGPFTDGKPVLWDKLKNYVAERIHRSEHL